MRSFFYLALLGVTLLTLSLVVRSGLLARRSPGRPINSAMRQALAAEAPQYTTDDAMLIAKTYGNARRSPSGLRWVERAPGTGEGKPRIGGEAIVNYDGRLLDGTSFDSSYKRGEPYPFRVGIGAVIPGWDEAILAMKKGEKRTLIVPYWLGYGEAGKPPKIPPRATLIFEIELLDFR